MWSPRAGYMRERPAKQKCRFKERRVKKVSGGKQNETQSCTCEVEIVPNAALLSPMHRGKQVSGFADVRENNDEQTTGANDLQQ